MSFAEHGEGMGTAGGYPYMMFPVQTEQRWFPLKQGCSGSRNSVL